MIVINHRNLIEQVPKEFQAFMYKRFDEVYNDPAELHVDNKPTPDKNGPLVFLEKGDDIRKLPWLNEEDGGLLFKDGDSYGWAWEACEIVQSDPVS